MFPVKEIGLGIMRLIRGGICGKVPLLAGQKTHR